MTYPSLCISFLSICRFSACRKCGHGRVSLVVRTCRVAPEPISTMSVASTKWSAARLATVGIAPQTTTVVTAQWLIVLTRLRFFTPPIIGEQSLGSRRFHFTLLASH